MSSTLQPALGESFSAATPSRVTVLSSGKLELGAPGKTRGGREGGEPVTPLCSMHDQLVVFYGAPEVIFNSNADNRLQITGEVFQAWYFSTDVITRTFSDKIVTSETEKSY